MTSQFEFGLPSAGATTHRCAMKNNTAWILAGGGLLISIGALPLVIGFFFDGRPGGTAHSNYLRGIAVAYDWMGREHDGRDLRYEARKIETDGVTVEFECSSKAERRALIA